MRTYIARCLAEERPLRPWVAAALRAHERRWARDERRRRAQELRRARKPEAGGSSGSLGT